MKDARTAGRLDETQVERLVREMTDAAAQLERTIADEERRTGVADAANFAYSTLAHAARARRDNQIRSADHLRRDRLSRAA